MRLADKKGKIFGIFNIIDLVLIVIVIVLAIGTFYKFKVLDKTSTSAKLEPVTYTVQIKKVRDYVIKTTENGDTLFDKTSGRPIGKIVNVESVQAKDELQLNDGTTVLAPIENRYDVTLTVEAEAAIEDEGYFVNRTYELLVNSVKKFSTKYFEFEARVGKIMTEAAK